MPASLARSIGVLVRFASICRGVAGGVFGVIELVGGLRRCRCDRQAQAQRRERRVKVLGVDRGGSDALLLKGFDDALGDRRGRLSDRSADEQTPNRGGQVQSHDESGGPLASGGPIGEQGAVQLGITRA